jgi:cyclase
MALSRRDFLKNSGLIGSALALMPINSLFATNPDNFITIRRNVGIFSQRGGTIGWLVNKDATVVVDSQFPDSAAVCLEGLKSKRNAPIDALINTHHHGDHTGGNSVFEPVTSIIVAHDRVPQLQRQQAQMRGEQISGLANNTYASEWKKDVGDETIWLKHYGPAHTGGDSVVTFEKANVVHMGDLVFNKVFPFIDRPGGANVQNWIKLLNGVLADHDTETLYIFGHGQADLGMVGRMDALVHMRSYLQALIDHVQSGIIAAQPREEIVGIASLPGFEDHISFGPRLSLAANLEVVFDELVAG